LRSSILLFSSSILLLPSSSLLSYSSSAFRATSGQPACNQCATCGQPVGNKCATSGQRGGGGAGEEGEVSAQRDAQRAPQRAAVAKLFGARAVDNEAVLARACGQVATCHHTSCCCGQQLGQPAAVTEAGEPCGRVGGERHVGRRGGARQISTNCGILPSSIQWDPAISANNGILPSVQTMGSCHQRKQWDPAI
jgi:hypothetical protein